MPHTRSQSQQLKDHGRREQEPMPPEDEFSYDESERYQQAEQWLRPLSFRQFELDILRRRGTDVTNIAIYLRQQVFNSVVLDILASASSGSSLWNAVENANSSSGPKVIEIWAQAYEALRQSDMFAETRAQSLHDCVNDIKRTAEDPIPEVVAMFNMSVLLSILENILKLANGARSDRELYEELVLKSRLDALIIETIPAFPEKETLGWSKQLAPLLAAFESLKSDMQPASNTMRTIRNLRVQLEKMDVQPQPTDEEVPEEVERRAPSSPLTDTGQRGKRRRDETGGAEGSKRPSRR